MFRILVISVLLLLALSSCSDTENKPKGSASSGMKCGAGKCGDSMQTSKAVKKEPAMKCGASKCGSKK